MSQFETINLTANGTIRKILFGRPERRNALSEQMYEELTHAVKMVSDDDEARVLILAGSGDTFCAGAEIGSADEKPVAAITRMRNHSDLPKAIFELRIPTITAVNGPAVGAGANLALVADFVLATEKAFIAELFVHRGMGFDWGGSWLIPRLVGLRKAKAIAMLGERIPAQEACDIGLISSVHDGLDNLMAAVDELANKLARMAPLALTMLKDELHASIGPSFADALRLETYGQVAIRQSEDAKEGFLSFKERRDPSFQGL